MSWVTIQGQELAHVENRLNLPVPPSGFQGYIHEPSYYRQGAIVRLKSPQRLLQFIAAGDGALSERQYFLLDGSSDPIHHGNRAAGIAIRTAAEAEAYLRFFLGVLEMPDGHCIRIVDALEPGWTTEGREEIDIAPAMVTASDRNGLFHARAHVEWDGALLMAEFAIRTDGIVAMMDDEPLGRLVRRKPH